MNVSLGKVQDATGLNRISMAWARVFKLVMCIYTVSGP